MFLYENVIDVISYILEIEVIIVFTHRLFFPHKCRNSDTLFTRRLGTLDKVKLGYTETNTLIV